MPYLSSVSCVAGSSVTSPSGLVISKTSESAL